MNNPNSNTLDPHIESHIDAYEDRLEAHGAADLRDFLPDRKDPQFLRIAAELIRVDLELSWEAGNEKSLDDYDLLLPELKENQNLRTEVAFEEFRQRCHHGQVVSIEEFSSKYDIAPEGWSTVVASSDETKTTEDFDELARRVPEAGQRWRDFEIIREIGRGALSRVLLAKQTSLSGREVVLKFAPKHLLEADKLARLQHSNIVPVFSVYEDRDFHVFCMPFLGNDTLSERESSISEAETLSILTKLADAIHHAHERGILHNDIKPANVLWVDGEPMLLDFNLAADVADAGPDQVGGTLPYMAPEALAGLVKGNQASDERSDIFSLGALTFEMLTGCHPFSTCSEPDAALATRKHLPSDADFADCSPSFKSIIRKCLAFEPGERYGSARELLTDVERQMGHRPLLHADNTSAAERIQKWSRRHPRLSSATTIAALVGAVIAASAMAVFTQQRNIGRLKAAAKFTDFQEAIENLLPELSSVGLDAVQPAKAASEAELLLARYVDSDGDWRSQDGYQDLSPPQRTDVDEQIAKLALLTSAVHTTLIAEDASHLQDAKRWSQIASNASTRQTRSALVLQSKLLELDGRPKEAARTQQQAENTKPESATDLQLVGWLTRVEGDVPQALEMLQSACEQDPRDYSKWFYLSQAHSDASQWQEAEHCLTTCLALRPASPIARYSRALCSRELGEHRKSVADFTEFLRIAPKHPFGLLNRAIAHKEAGHHQAALVDLNTVIEGGFNSTRPLLIRSRVRRELRDRRGAREDLDRALAATPIDDIGWVARGVAKMIKQPKDALRDFRHALKLNPRSHAARRNIAYLLSEQLSKTEEAIDCLDNLLEDYPLDEAAYGGRGVLLARLGRFDEAIMDAKQIVQLKSGPRALLQAACIYSMGSEKQPEWKKVAVELLGASFKMDPQLANLATEDSDLKEIHDFAAFMELCDAAKRLADVPDPQLAIQVD